MLRHFLLGKIHRATVTRADLGYVGSITLDPLLIEAAGFMENEKVDIYDVTNGSRLSTYVIPGVPGSGEGGINGYYGRDADWHTGYSAWSQDFPAASGSRSPGPGRTLTGGAWSSWPVRLSSSPTTMMRPWRNTKSTGCPIRRSSSTVTLQLPNQGYGTLTPN